MMTPLQLSGTHNVSIENLVRVVSGRLALIHLLITASNSNHTNTLSSVACQCFHVSLSQRWRCTYRIPGQLSNPCGYTEPQLFLSSQHLDEAVS